MLTTGTQPVHHSKFIVSFYIFLLCTSLILFLWNSVYVYKAGGWAFFFLIFIIFYSSMTANNATNTNFVFLCCNLIIYYDLWTTTHNIRLDKRLWNFIWFSFYILVFFFFICLCLKRFRAWWMINQEFMRLSNTLKWNE